MVDDLQIIENAYFTKMKEVKTTFLRYLYHEINWDSRLIGIKGMRGVGKTTLLLQRIKLAHANLAEAFYVSLDNLWFQSHNLQDLIAHLYTHGVHYLYLDEVHKYPYWSQIIKNAYDTYAELNIVYTGSSMLEIDNSKVDLSRRQTVYLLHGMSFREYLSFQQVCDLSPVGLVDLLNRHTTIAMDLPEGVHILPHFESYLRTGYYPFSKDAGRDYLIRLAEVAQLVIENDLPAVEEISYATMVKAKRLLMVIAQNVPLVPNISRLCAQLECTRDICLRLLYALDRAGLLMLLTRLPKDYKHLVSPEKIFLNNGNLMHALTPSPNIGTMRETFFLNQVSATAGVTMPGMGDFFVGEKWLFEVGGRGKSFDQIADMPDSYLAVDGIEVGSSHVIPLWMFGLLY